MPERMTKDRYCVEICKGQCCTLYSKEEGMVQCPKQNPDGGCSVYRERYADGMPDLVVIGYYKSRAFTTLDGKAADRPFFCGRIEQLLANGSISKVVEQRCCYAHPEVLEEYED